MLIDDLEYAEQSRKQIGCENTIVYHTVTVADPLLKYPSVATIW
jgi:hypothetical protein